jgi:hypothetical protein
VIHKLQIKAPDDDVDKTYMVEKHALAKSCSARSRVGITQGRWFRLTAWPLTQQQKTLFPDLKAAHPDKATQDLHNTTGRIEPTSDVYSWTAKIFCGHLFSAIRFLCPENSRLQISGIGPQRTPVCRDSSISTLTVI